MANEETTAEVTRAEELELESESKDSKKGLSKTLKIALAGVSGLLINGLLAYYLTTSFVIPEYFSASSDSTAVTVQPEAKPVQVTPAATSSQVTNNPDDSNKSQENEFYSLKHIVVNPYGTNGRRFLALDMSIGANSSSTVRELKGNDAQIRDEINTFLSRKTVAELTNIVSKRKIKKDLKNLLNGILERGEVNEIYFTKYVLQ